MEDNKSPRGRREAPPPWGAPKAPLVVFHVVRISNIFAHFRTPFCADFPNLVRIGSGTHPGFEIVFFCSPTTCNPGTPTAQRTASAACASDITSTQATVTSSAAKATESTGEAGTKDSTQSTT